MRNKDLFSPNALLSSKLAFGALIIGIIVVLIQWIGLIPKSTTTYEEIRSAREEVNELEAQQKKLQELNTFLQSDFFAEKEARTKLGMQKKGEQVVILDSNIGLKDDHNESGDKAENNSFTTPPGAKSNEQKNTAVWWQYFFGEE